jgi:hypothetical protein
MINDAIRLHIEHRLEAKEPFYEEVAVAKAAYFCVSTKLPAITANRCSRSSNWT